MSLALTSAPQGSPLPQPLPTVVESGSAVCRLPLSIAMGRELGGGASSGVEVAGRPLLRPVHGQELRPRRVAGWTEVPVAAWREGTAGHRSDEVWHVAAHRKQALARVREVRDRLQELLGVRMSRSLE